MLENYTGPFIREKADILFRDSDDFYFAIDIDIRTVFNAPARATAEAYLARIEQKYEKTASWLADWLE